MGEPKHPEHPNYALLGPTTYSGTARCVWCSQRIADGEGRQEVTVRGAPKGMPDQHVHKQRCADAYLATRRKK